MNPKIILKLISSHFKSLFECINKNKMNRRFHSFWIYGDSTHAQYEPPTKQENKRSRLKIWNAEQ